MVVETLKTAIKEKDVVKFKYEKVFLLHKNGPLNAHTTKCNLKVIIQSKTYLNDQKLDQFFLLHYKW